MPASTSSRPSTSNISSRSTTSWSITGVTQHETVPDPLVRAPTRWSWSTWLPRRFADGWPTATSTPRTHRSALGNYFRTGNLTALRELALLWVADRVDEELNDYRERHNIAGPWETKERVVVSLTGSRGSAVLIRRAAGWPCGPRPSWSVYTCARRQPHRVRHPGPGPQPGAPRRPRRALRRGGRGRSGAGTGPGGPGRKRHPAGHGGHPPAAGSTSSLRGSVINSVIRAAGRLAGCPCHRHRGRESDGGPDRDDGSTPGVPTPVRRHHRLPMSGVPGAGAYRRQPALAPVHSPPGGRPGHRPHRFSPPDAGPHRRSGR